MELNMNVKLNDMRYTIFLLLLPVISFCQVQINEPSKRVSLSEVKSFGAYRAQMDYIIQDKDTMFIMTFINDKYSTLVDLKSVSFYSEGGSFEALYKLMKSVYLPENKDNKNYFVSFKLGKENVSVSRVFNSMCMFSTQSGYINLTEKQIDKLFGKR